MRAAGRDRPPVGVVRRGALYLEYYTSRVDRDYPWVLGMFLPTHLRMVRILLALLRQLIAAKQAEADEGEELGR